MSNTAPSIADPVVVFPLSHWCPPQETSQPHPPHHFSSDMWDSKCFFFLNENVWVSIKISLKFVPKGPINIIPALVQIMARRRPGRKPLSEPMMGSLLTHTCVTLHSSLHIQIATHLYCRSEMFFYNKYDLQTTLLILRNSSISGGLKPQSITVLESGSWQWHIRHMGNFNVKMLSYQHWNSHSKD